MYSHFTIILLCAFIQEEEKRKEIEHQKAEEWLKVCSCNVQIVLVLLHGFFMQILGILRCYVKSKFECSLSSESR